jgi:hypothetical protein
VRKIFVKYDEAGAAVGGSLDAPLDDSYTLYTEAETDTEAAAHWPEVFTLDFSAVLNQSAPYFFPLKFAVSLDHAKEFLRREVWAEYDNALQFVFQKYPEAEREGWPLKWVQAVDWLQTPPADKPALIESLASPLCVFRILLREAVPDRELTSGDVSLVDELCMLIIQNGAIFQDIYGRMTGYKTIQMRLVDTLSSVGDVNAFTLNFPQFLPVGG